MPLQEIVFQLNDPLISDSYEYYDFDLTHRISVGDILYVSALSLAIESLVAVGEVVEIEQDAEGSPGFVSIIFDFITDDGDLNLGGDIGVVDSDQLLDIIENNPDLLYFYALPKTSINKPAVKGYFAKCVWRNNEKDQRSELFNTSVGTIESSK